MITRSDVSVAIPTYGRGRILVETLERLLQLSPRAEEIIVVDQTPHHPHEVEIRLAELDRNGDIVWIRLDAPSIPRAMNRALLSAKNDVVLFVDDDVEVPTDLAAAHAASHIDQSIWAVVGQVLQPGERPEHFDEQTLRCGLLRDLEFRFNHDEPCDVENTIACNLSVKRQQALEIGGVDENFVGAAHRFETDFARRVVASGGRVRFDPSASLHHLKLATGGLRSYGNHMIAVSPLHSVGDYYFAALHADHLLSYAADRLTKNVVTRYHAARPWTIPAKLLGEVRGMMLARRLYRDGRRLLPEPRDTTAAGSG